ncbi:hypothetical protein GOD93_28100 [Sinorhizobium medicae]|nr:hypothetical protein [Sinorhizobium medicae]
MNAKATSDHTKSKPPQAKKRKKRPKIAPVSTSVAQSALALETLVAKATELHAKISMAADEIASAHAEFSELMDTSDVMSARSAHCNKPAVIYRKMPDGSWLECYLQSDCSYAGCRPIAAELVPVDK